MTGPGLGIARFLGFGSLLVLVGAGTFAVALFPSLAGERRTRRILWTSLGALAVACALGIGLADGTERDVWLLRAGIVVIGGVLVRTLARGDHPAWRAAATITALALLASPALTGHADEGRWIALAKVIDLLHVGAAAVWVGGLVILVGVVLRTGTEEARAITERFSPIAFGAIAVVVVTGAVQSVRQIDALDGIDTAYGHLLVAKVITVCLLIGVAMLTRAALQDRFDFDDRVAEEAAYGPGAQHVDEHREVRMLRCLVGAEIIVALAVLVLTTLLVDAAPTQATPSASPFDQTHVVDDALINVVIVPGVVGSNDVHLYVDNPSGGLTPPVGASARLFLPTAGVTGIEVPFVRAGPKHWTANDIDVPAAGRWELTVDVLVTDVDTATTTFIVPIGGSS